MRSKHFFRCVKKVRVIPTPVRTLAWESPSFKVEPINFGPEKLGDCHTRKADWFAMTGFSTGSKNQTANAAWFFVSERKCQTSREPLVSRSPVSPLKSWYLFPEKPIFRASPDLKSTSPKITEVRR